MRDLADQPVPGTLQRGTSGPASTADFGARCVQALPRLYRYLYALAGDADAAADLSQQTILQALAARQRYQTGNVPFEAWLFRIARNLAIDRRRRRDPLPLDPLTEAPEPAGGADPQAIVLHQEALAQLDALLRRLDQEKRELLALRFAGGLSAREIATVVGKSEAAVKKQLTRTIQQLKEDYDAD